MTTEQKADALIESVKNWGRARNITNPDKQTLKVIEEASEIVREIVRGRYDSIDLQDAIGDTTVTLIVLADILGYDFLECLELAYDTIKDRTGKTKDGTFVKSDDQ